MMDNKLNNETDGEYISKKDERVFGCGFTIVVIILVSWLIKIVFF